jgi:hypothetical protein
MIGPPFATSEPHDWASSDLDSESFLAPTSV